MECKHNMWPYKVIWRKYPELSLRDLLSWQRYCEARLKTQPLQKLFGKARGGIKCRAAPTNAMTKGGKTKRNAIKTM